MADDSKDRTLWCGNLHEDVTEEILYELFVQGGPLDQVKIPMGDGRKKSFAFITFRHTESVPYSLELMSDVRLFGQSLRLQFRPGSIHEQPRGYRQPQQVQPQGPPQMTANNMGFMPMPLMPTMAMGMGGMGGMVMEPLMNQAGFGMNNPLRPQMGAVLHGTGFHRSNSTPDFSQRNMMPMGQRGGQSSMGNQGADRGGHGRDYNKHNYQQESGSRGHHQDRHFGRKRPHDDRSKDSPGEDSHYRQDRRSGDQHYRDRSREDRRGRDMDRREERRDGDSDKPRDSGKSGSSGKSSGRDAPVDPHTLASQNFRRTMASPPWQRSKPPWQ